MVAAEWGSVDYAVFVSLMVDLAFYRERTEVARVFGDHADRAGFLVVAERDGGGLAEHFVGGGIEQKDRASIERDPRPVEAQPVWRAVKHFPSRFLVGTHLVQCPPQRAAFNICITLATLCQEHLSGSRTFLRRESLRPSQRSLR